MTPLALVHHANQFLVTDGYDDREGLSDVLAGYRRVLALHERRGIPLSLHVSGTLLEAAAWHDPDFLRRVAALADAGLVGLLGGTYAENVMPLFAADVNRRQLAEYALLHERLLERPRRELRTCWIPERVWSTRKLAPVLADSGYRSVLLDDRLLAPDRDAFDLGFPSRPTPAPVRIAGGRGLAAVPIAASLRYRIPPRTRRHWRLLAEAARDAQGLLVYADDLEKTAGVGPWRRALDEYDAFLARLPELGLEPVLLDTWLDANPPAAEREVADGAFHELARRWRAGDDYRGWWESPRWAPYRRSLATAEAAVRSAEHAGAEPRLLELAWKHLLASQHETAWHDEGTEPAPWAKALASHARSALPIAGAGVHFAAGDGRPHSELRDVDGDGEDEVVLRNGDLYAVVSPGRGGRLVLLAHRDALVVGNPTDHWNWQEELNRFMDRPPNHPGALVDVGREHRRYRLAGLGRGSVALECDGVRKRIALVGAAVAVAYEAPEGLAVECCLSPDYLELLRSGRRAVERLDAHGCRGFACGKAAVWLAVGHGERVDWEDARPDPGHGLNLRLRAHERRFHLLLACSRETPELRVESVDEREVAHAA